MDKHKEKQDDDVPIELKQLREKFLNPIEDNRNDLIKLIQQAFDILPSSLEENDPFLGEPCYDYSFLSDFEEIPLKPKKRETILSAATSLLRGQIRWHSPAALHNITPPVMLDSIAMATLTNLYNPNMIWDFVSPGVHQLEQQVVRQIASLVGWESESEGVFTFGGKACLVYAIRIGLNRCLPGVAVSGLSQLQSPVVITSEYNHYIIENVCSFLGLGSNACIRVKTKSDETLDLVEFQITLEEAIQNKRPIACIILSGGNTLHIAIDPLREAVEIVNKLCDKYQMSYRPYIYFDTVVGWPWLFFKDYDFKNNPLQLNSSALGKIDNAKQKISAAVLADAVGIDFHKIGFCSYSTSMFVTKTPAELHSINKDSIIKQDRQPFGGNFLQHYTIEHSRSAAPVLAAWTVLQNAGIVGFQAYLGYLTEVGDIFRDVLPQFNLELLNPFSVGFASVYCPILRGSNYKYEDLLESSVKDVESYNQYAYKLFQYIGGKKAELGNKIVLRYLPKYRQAKCGSWPAVITVYPMSSHFTVKKAMELAHEIGTTKHLFELEFDKEARLEEIPNAIHK